MLDEHTVASMRTLCTRPGVPFCTSDSHLKEDWEALLDLKKEAISS